MRELSAAELESVAGGVYNGCNAEYADNVYAGVSDPSSFGQDMVNFYEGLVFLTSHVFERIAEAF